MHLVDFFPSDNERDTLWWDPRDLQQRNILECYTIMHSKTMVSPSARDYLDTCAHIYHEVCCGAVNKISNDTLADLLPGLDEGLRGTEMNCTEIGNRRKQRSREIVRQIVDQSDMMERPESLRFHSCRFTKNSRKMAQIMAKADRMAVEADQEQEKEEYEQQQQNKVVEDTNQPTLEQQEI